MSTELSEVVIEYPPDDALQEIQDTVPTLTVQEAIYIYWRMIGENAVNAFKKAGYRGSSWKSVETRPKVREALATMIEKIAPDHRITQKTVVNILMEAIDIAREKAQAGNMIEGAKVLGEVTGVAAAAKIQIQNNTDIRVTHVDENRVLRELPMNQLERLLDIERTLPALTNIVDAEFEEIKR